MSEILDSIKPKPEETPKEVKVLINSEDEEDIESIDNNLNDGS